MGNEITIPEIIQQLRKYRFQAELNDSFEVASLLEEEILKDFIENLTMMIKAPSVKVTASIFMKRYAFVAVMSLYAMTVWNKMINVSINDLSMQNPEQGKAWLPSFSIKNVSESDEKWSGHDRKEWRARVLHELFAENISLLIDKFEKTFKISKLILWENIAVYLFWLYEVEMKDVVNPNKMEDFRFLIFEAEGKLFGAYKINPLKKYYSEKKNTAASDDEIRIRKTCCYNYTLQGASTNCKTCPCKKQEGIKGSVH